MWQNDMNRRKEHPQKRGRPKITLHDLEEELAIKKEKIKEMEKSATFLLTDAKDQIIDEMDLEEYNELLDTDDDPSDSEAETCFESNSLNAKMRCSKGNQIILCCFSW